MTQGNFPAFYYPKEVEDMLRVSKPTLWRMRQRLGFPEPVKLLEGRKVYRAAEVHAWIASRLKTSEPV